MDATQWQVHWEMGALAGAQPNGMEAEVAMRNLFDAKQFPRRPVFNFIHGAVSASVLWGNVTAACGACPQSQRKYETLCAVEGCRATPCPECPAAFQRKYGTRGMKLDKVVALLDRYSGWGTTLLEPLRCVAPLSDKFDFSGSKLIRAAKETGMNKGWHPGGRLPSAPYTDSFAGRAARSAVSRRPPISFDTIGLRTEGYTHAAKVWVCCPSSKGHSLSGACRTPIRPIRNFHKSLYGGDGRAAQGRTDTS
jgi:hypothetical protein